MTLIDLFLKLTHSDLFLMFVGTGDGSLSMAVGQQFTVIDHDQGDGWTQVKSSDKTVGYVPTSYIKFNN